MTRSLQLADFLIRLIVVSVFLASCAGGGSTPPASPKSSLPITGGPSGGTSSSVNPSKPGGGAQTVTISEYTLGSTPSNGGIAIAGDGSIWTESDTTSFTATFVRWNNGSVTSYPIDSTYNSVGYGSIGIVAAANGHVFAFGETNNPNQLFGMIVQQVFEIGDSGGAITAPPSGQFISDGTYTGQIVGLVSAAHESVWTAESFAFESPFQGGVFEITPGNTSIDLPQIATQETAALAPGPDGNIWVGTVTQQLNGSLTYAMLVYSMAGNLLKTFAMSNLPNAMVAGPDGAMWFTTQNGLIGRMTTLGKTTYYSSQTTTGLGGITVGSDGALWYLELYSNRLGRMTTSGVSTDYRIPTSDSFLPGVFNGIAGPANGCQPYTLWFAEPNSGKIAKVVYK